jgi:PII-like signaling protein
MLARGPAKKVTIFVNADTRHRLSALHDALMNFLLHKNVAGATATRALSGYGSHRWLHDAESEYRAERVPIRIEFIESAAKVDEILPTLYEMVTDGLIEVQDTVVVKAVQKDKAAELPARERRTGPAKLMRVFLGEADRWQDEPLHEAIVKRLLLEDIAGATVYKGILGYGAKRHTHKPPGLLSWSHDAPIMISIIDSPEKIARAEELVAGMLGDGLIVTSDVNIIRSVRIPPAASGAEADETAG